MSVTLRWAASFVVSIIALMGLAKAIDLPSFARAVREWEVIPSQLRVLVVIVVPAVELALGAWLLSRKWRLALILTALAVLLAFSGVLAAQWILAGKAPCACFGVLGRRLRQIESAEFGLLRNGLMSLVLVPHLITLARSPLRLTSDPSEAANSTSPRARGFTLMETLAVIAVIGVLLAISAPSISRVRNHGRAGTTLANLKTHSNIAVVYTTDYRDYFPSLTDPRASYSVIRCESADLAVRSLYFGSFNLWNIGLADQYYGGLYQSRSFQSGWDPRGNWTSSGLHWACSFSADPAYFDLVTRRLPPAQFRAVRASEVLFPSHKSVLTAYAPWVRFRRVFGGMVDGRAAEFRDRELLGDVRSGDGAYPQYTVHWPAFTPMTHTVHGARGRDVR